MRAIQATRLPARVTLHHHRLAFLPSLDQSITETELLRGARYTVLRVPTHLHVYEVWSGRHIWTQAIERNTRFSADIAPGSDKLRVLLTPETGNISLQEVGPRNRSILGSINFQSAPRETKLRPGYILQAYPDSTPPHQLHLAVTDLRSLSPHLKPLHEFNLDDRLSLQDIAFTAPTGRSTSPLIVLTYQMYSYRFTPASSGKSCEISTPVALNRQFTRRRQQVNGREETVVVCALYKMRMF
ncbi:hypothetical protein B0H14DRAFT_2664394 [Mycena olivaceomarginata]|nr:hypothetical protein B0H14DRAFT_2664394 [Mycena olivaceomarginata]